MFKVTIWNGEVQRTWNIITDSRSAAINKAIKNEMEIYRIPRYRIEIEEVHKFWKGGQQNDTERKIRSGDDS